MKLVLVLLLSFLDCRKVGACQKNLFRFFFLDDARCSDFFARFANHPLGYSYGGFSWGGGDLFERLGRRLFER